LARTLLVVLLAVLVVRCGPRGYPTRAPVESVGSRVVEEEATRPLPTVPPCCPVLTATAVESQTQSLAKTEIQAQTYVVKSGDTLSSIARRHGCDVGSLIQVNGIADPNTLEVGRRLQIPSPDLEASSSDQMLPDSEFVYSPAYVDFDIGAFSATQGGYLNQHKENVDGKLLSGPEIVERSARHYSVGPRMLLALLELRSGWLTDPNPVGRALSHPMGRTGDGWGLLSRQLDWAANELNRGYYDWRGRGVTSFSWGDGSVTKYGPGLNAASAGLQYFLSRRASKGQWQAWVGNGPGSFAATYRRLFGDPDQYAIEPLLPADIASPTLVLPWVRGETWYLTSGPHGAWGSGSAWSAVDFVPDEGYLGCRPASAWVTASAPGLVIHSEGGEVLIDLDGDGHEQTGWVLCHLHIASKGRVAAGTYVKQGDPIGHPSCEGGTSDASHLHIARKYNGEWIAADGPLPLVMSGWQFHSGATDYEGSATRDGETRSPCECWEEEYNGLLADR
jgi:LasA protease